MKLSVNEISKIYSALNSERYNIGDTVWFVASCIDPMKMDIEYSSYTVSDTNAAYRLVAIPIKGIIQSIYVNHFSLAYSNGIPEFVPTGGTRFNKDEIQDIDKYYDPKKDTLTYEIKTLLAPGIIRPPIVTPTMYTPENTFSFFYSSHKWNKVFFADAFLRVANYVVGSTPEEAEKKYLVSSIYHVRNLNKLSHKNDSYSRAQLRRFTVANLCDV